MLHPPIKTVANPNVIEPPCAVLSPNRAAGLPLIITVEDPCNNASGGPAHKAMSPTTAAGRPPISTVGTPGPIMGPPTWGVGTITGHTCISVILAAGCPNEISFSC